MFYGASLGRSFDSSSGHFEIGFSTENLSSSFQYGFITKELNKDFLHLTPIMLQITAKSALSGRLKGYLGGGFGYALTDYTTDKKLLAGDLMAGYKAEVYVDPAPIFKITGGFEYFVDKFSIVFTASNLYLVI